MCAARVSSLAGCSFFCNFFSSTPSPVRSYHAIECVRKVCASHFGRIVSFYVFASARARRSACERGVGFGVFRKCSLFLLVKCFFFSFCARASQQLVIERTNERVCCDSFEFRNLFRVFFFFWLVSKTESVRVGCVLCVSECCE